MLKDTVVRVIFVLSCVFFLGMAQGILVYHLQKTQAVFFLKKTRVTDNNLRIEKQPCC